MGTRLSPSGPFTAAAVARRIKNQTGGQQNIPAGTTQVIEGLPFDFRIRPGSMKRPKVTAVLQGAWLGGVVSSVGIITVTLSVAGGGSAVGSTGSAVVTANLNRPIIASFDTDDQLDPNELLSGNLISMNAEFFADNDGDLTAQDFMLIVDLFDSADDSPFLNT